MTTTLGVERCARSAARVGLRTSHDAEGRPIGVPTGLPVQALDYATGFIAVGLAAQLVTHQRDAGGSWLGRTSLLRTRDHLVGRSTPTSFRVGTVVADPRFLDTVDSDFGRVTAVRPFAGTWPSPPRPLATSAPAWASSGDQ